MSKLGTIAAVAAIGIAGVLWFSWSDTPSSHEKIEEIEFDDFVSEPSESVSPNPANSEPANPEPDEESTDRAHAESEKPPQPEPKAETTGEKTEETEVRVLGVEREDRTASEIPEEGGAAEEDESADKKSLSKRVRPSVRLRNMDQLPVPIKNVQKLPFNGKDLPKPNGQPSGNSK